MLSEKDFKKLFSIFSSSPHKGILESQNYLMKPNFSNYEDFLTDVKKTQKSNCCIVSWNKSMLSARCLDCQKKENSCICIPCFLAGKHDQHHSYLLGGSGAGNCDCGDPCFWKPEGNCPNHPGPDPNPDLTQMTKENRDKFITVFKSAFMAVYTKCKDENRCIILEWISGFISIGDGLRRCVSIAISSIPEKMFFQIFQVLTKNSLTCLIDLFGKLISDRIFAQKIGSMSLRNYLQLRNVIASYLFKRNFDKKAAPFHPIKKYLSFSFHFFTEAPLNYLIKNFNFDWVEFILDCLKFVFNTAIKLDMNYDRLNDGSIISELWYMTCLLEFLVNDDSQHDNIQRFLDEYSHLLIKYERLYIFHFPRVPEDDSLDPFSSFFLFIYLYQINLIFAPTNDRSPKNKTFSISKTFASLLAYLKSQKKLHTSSLFNGQNVGISSFLPLHHLFYCLLSSHQKTGRVLAEECKKNKISLQEFCELSTICPIRILVATFVPDRFQMLNRASRRHITYLLDRPEETFNILFGLVQTMLGVAPDKDAILFNISTTFGICDEVPEMPKLPILDRRKHLEQMMDHQNQVEMCESAIFDFSIFVTSLLTDRSIITFDKILFKRLRVIELLMNKKPNSQDIEKYVDDKISNPIFGDDLQSYAVRVSTSNGSFFKLTNEDEFTPFFPVINRVNRIAILMKYKDKLINVPEFTPLPRELNMEDCFRKPTYLSSMFFLLSSQQQIFVQIGLAMFILSVRNGEKFDLESYDFSSQVVIKVPHIIPLIESFMQIMSSNPHFNFLSMKIKFGEKNTMSILEAVQSHKRLGLSALEKADIPAIFKPQIIDDDQLQKEKKQKAINLKKQLMKEFQNQRQQFAAGGGGTTSNNQNDDEDDNEDDRDELRSSLSRRGFSSTLNVSNDILCNVCQNNVPDDVLGFPCLSLPCLFPSLINNKLHNLGIPYEKLEKVFSMSICMHHLHLRCYYSILKDTDYYHCMIDRGKRNCFLPLFPSQNDEFHMNLSEMLNLAIQSFMNSAFPGISIEKQPIELFKSFAGIVMITEVRHRCRPECLDSPTIPALLRNLLLTFYYTWHKNEYQIAEEIKDPLLKLVYLTINSNSPKSEFSLFVKQISNSLKGDYLYEFLRRAAIIEDFALNEFKSDNKFIDWDEILSFENLLQRFDVENKENIEIVELPIFETIPLAERFVSLYQPPYNMDIFNNSLCKFIDLLTGKVVVFSKKRSTLVGKTDLPYVDDYVDSQYDGGLVMFMGLTGPNASDIIISCRKLGYLFNLDGFYVDQFGDIDRGFLRGALLSISNDRLENALDKLLSGDVILFS